MNTNVFTKWFSHDKSATDPNIIKIGEPVSLAQYESDASTAGNLVITQQTRLGFPVDDIYVTMPDEKSDKETVFEFFDSKDILFGKYKYIKTEGNSFDLDKLINVYAKEILDNVVSKTIHKTYVDGREAFIIDGKIKDKKFDYSSVVVLEGSNLTVFALITNENFLMLNPEYSRKIFASYKFIKNKGTVSRVRKNFLSFQSDSRNWMFFKDAGKNDKGFHTFYESTDEDITVLVSLYEVNYKNIQEMKADYIDDTVTFFEDTFSFKGKKITGGGYEHKEWMVYLLEYNGVKMRFCVLLRDAKKENHLLRSAAKISSRWEQMIKIIDEAYYLNF